MSLAAPARRPRPPGLFSFIAVAGVLLSAVVAAALALSDRSVMEAAGQVLVGLSSTAAAIVVSLGVLVVSLVAALRIVQRAGRDLGMEGAIAESIAQVLDKDRREIESANHEALQIGETEDSARAHFLAAEHGHDMHRDRVFPRLVTTMVSGARSLSFETPSAMVALYEPEITDHSRRLRELQTAAIRVGIMFTFVGLVGAMEPVTRLFGLGAATAPTPAQTAALMREVVGALGLAFGTSVAGLLAALMIAVLLGALRRREDVLLARVQTVAQGLQFVLRNSRFPASVTRMFEDHGKHLAAHTTAMNKHALNVTESEKALARHLDGQDQAIKGFVANLQGGRDALSVVMTAQTAEVVKLGQAYRELTGVEARIAQGVEKALDGAAAKASETFARHVATLSGAVGALTPLTDGAAARLADTTRAQVEALQGLAAVIEAAERSRRRWRFAATFALVAGAVALAALALYAPEARNALGIAP